MLTSLEFSFKSISAFYAPKLSVIGGHVCVSAVFLNSIQRDIDSENIPNVCLHKLFSQKIDFFEQ